MEGGSKIVVIAGMAALIAASAFTTVGAAQDDAQAEQLITEKDLLTKAGSRPELKAWLEGLRGTSTLPVAQGAEAPLPGTGLLIDLDGPDSFSLLRVPADDGGLMLTPEAARRLLLTPSANRLSTLRLDVALQLFRVQATASPERTVAPDDIIATPIPGAFRELPGFTPRPSVMPPAARDCALSQNRFLKDIEGELRSGTLTLNRSDDEWATLFDAAKAFDHDCLEPIAIAPNDPAGVPLDRLAVLTAPGEGSFCMAAYLGEGRFITANHCRFDIWGAPRDNLVVSLADGSKTNLPARFTSESQPFASRGAADWAILVAPVLNGHHPASVLRTVAPAVHGDIRLIGYFGLANLAATVESRQRPLWKDALRATRDIGINACRIVDVAPGGSAGGCVMHDCQSLPGFSGAPLFVRSSDGSWGLAGVHVASAQADVVTACPTFAGSAYFAGAGNIAAGIPPAIAAQINAGS